MIHLSLLQKFASHKLSEASPRNKLLRSLKFIWNFANALLSRQRSLPAIYYSRDWNCHWNGISRSTFFHLYRLLIQLSLVYSRYSRLSHDRNMQKKGFFKNCLKQEFSGMRQIKFCHIFRDEAMKLFKSHHVRSKKSVHSALWHACRATFPTVKRKNEVHIW